MILLMLPKEIVNSPLNCQNGKRRKKGKGGCQGIGTIFFCFSLFSVKILQVEVEI